MANFDIAAIFKAVCKFTTVAHSPGEGVQAVQRAIKHAITGRPGPTAAISRMPSALPPPVRWNALQICS